MLVRQTICHEIIVFLTGFIRQRYTLFASRVIHNCFTCCISVHGHCHAWPYVSEFSGAYWGEGRGKKERQTIFLERTAEGEHWSRFKGDVCETSERRVVAHMGISERSYTILNRKEWNWTVLSRLTLSRSTVFTDIWLSQTGRLFKRTVQGNALLSIMGQETFVINPTSTWIILSIKHPWSDSLHHGTVAAPKPDQLLWTSHTTNNHCEGETPGNNSTMPDIYQVEPME